MESKEHWKAIEEHGFSKLFKVDIIDEDGEMELPVKNGKIVTEYEKTCSKDFLKIIEETDWGTKDTQPSNGQKREATCTDSSTLTSKVYQSRISRILSKIYSLKNCI